MHEARKLGKRAAMEEQIRYPKREEDDGIER